MRKWRVSDGWVTGRESLQSDIQVVRVKKWRVTGKIEIHWILRQFTTFRRFGVEGKQNANIFPILLPNYVVEVGPCDSYIEQSPVLYVPLFCVNEIL